jgi:phytanoyl-CoA hydroxylase
MSNHVDEYEKHGYTILRRVLDPQLIQETGKHIDWLLETNPERRPEQLAHTLMTKDAFWVRLVADHRLLDVAEAFLGPNIALFASHYICKPPGDGQPVLWHQDGGYWPLEPMNVITLWLAVDRADSGNGCMRVVPGTQHESLKEVLARNETENVLASSIDESVVDESKAVDIELEPGDVSVHHPNIFHGSNANTSDRWRRGLTIRYIPTTTKILKESSGEELEPGKSFPSAFLLRGEAHSGVNLYNPYPRFTPELSMPFRGSKTWNDSAKTWNNRNTGVIAPR